MRILSRVMTAAPTKEVRFFADTIFFFEKKKKTSCNFGHLPVCQNYKSESGSTYGDKCRFRHVEAEDPAKSKKGGARGSVALLKESTQLGCVSQDSYPRKSSLRELGKFGSTHGVKFSKDTWQKIKNSGKKGPSQGIIQKCEPHERSPCAPKFEARSQEETFHQEGGVRSAAWDMAKNLYKVKNADKAALYTPIEARVMAAPTSKRPEER